MYTQIAESVVDKFCEVFAINFIGRMPAEVQLNLLIKYDGRLTVELNCAESTISWVNGIYLFNGYEMVDFARFLLAICYQIMFVIFAGRIRAYNADAVDVNLPQYSAQIYRQTANILGIYKWNAAGTYVIIVKRYPQA